MKKKTKDTVKVRANKLVNWFSALMRLRLLEPKNLAKKEWRELSKIENMKGIVKATDDAEKVFHYVYLQPKVSPFTHADVIRKLIDIANRAAMLADQVALDEKQKRWEEGHDTV